MAARDHNKNGDKESAIYCLRISKDVAKLLERVQSGHAVDLAKLPPAPQVLAASVTPASRTIPVKGGNVSAAEMPKKSERDECFDNIGVQDFVFFVA